MVARRAALRRTSVALPDTNIVLARHVLPLPKPEEDRWAADVTRYVSRHAPPDAQLLPHLRAAFASGRDVHVVVGRLRVELRRQKDDHSSDVRLVPAVEPRPLMPHIDGRPVPTQQRPPVGIARPARPVHPQVCR